MLLAIIILGMRVIRSNKGVGLEHVLILCACMQYLCKANVSYCIRESYNYSSLPVTRS